MPRFGDGGGLKELEESLFAVASLALKSALGGLCLDRGGQLSDDGVLLSDQGKNRWACASSRRRGREGHQGDEVRAHDRHCAGCGSSWKQNPVNGYENRTQERRK